MISGLKNILRNYPNNILNFPKTLKHEGLWLEKCIKTHQSLALSVRLCVIISLKKDPPLPLFLTWTLVVARGAVRVLPGSRTALALIPGHCWHGRTCESGHGDDLRILGK